MKARRLWSGNEEAELDRLILEYSSGEDHELDEELVAYDLKASRAHARMLRDRGYLKEHEFAALEKAISALSSSHSRGEWRISLEEEDCHTAIENRLNQLAGAAGAAIHLGRSRNDQVLVALRLWLKDRLRELAQGAEAVAAGLDRLAESYKDQGLPGYTHLQRAMPSSVADWALGFAAELRDDAQGLALAARRADKNPLGSAAGYGVPVLELDRVQTARELGFGAVHEPVTAVQLSRGKAEATALFEAALLAQDLGRLAADLCLFASTEFGFVKLPERFTTGSSIMPQKRNPDVFELVRGRTGEAQAALHEVLNVTTRLTSGYHRDLQLIKKPLFRGLASVARTTEVLAHALDGIEFDRARLNQALSDPGLYAAEEAYRLVGEKGVPFREAYRIVKAKFER